MTIDEARANIGRGVVYTSTGGDVKEDGLIRSVGPETNLLGTGRSTASGYVFVTYGRSTQATATDPKNLQLLVRP